MIDVQINKKHYKDAQFLVVNAGITGSDSDRNDVIQCSQNKFSDFKPEKLKGSGGPCS